MDPLARAGLFGGGLLPVDTPDIVARYNACLVQLGIAPTTLSSFRIDGIGWSPEIAAERGDDFYLCAGIANPMGVVVSPEQRGKPVYHPFNSYDRRLLQLYFDKFHNAIADITATAFVGLDIDHELTKYQSPRDLLLVRYIVVRSVAGGLFDAAREQRELVERFLGEDLGWFDAGLRDRLRASARQWGDLRYRRTDIPPMKLDVESFQTCALGGVFVLRCLRDATVLALEDASVMDSVAEARALEYDIRDPRLTDRLLADEAVQVDLGWYRDHPEVLADKKEGLLADVVCAECPDLRFAALKVAQKRQYGARMADRLPPVYHELERLVRELETGALPDVDHLSPALRLLLMRPNPQLPDSEQEVLWLLLCRLQPADVVRLYRSDKNQFFAQYRTWTPCKQEWAVDLVMARYADPGARVTR